MNNKKWYQLTIYEKIEIIKENFITCDFHHIVLIATSGRCDPPSPTESDGTHADGHIRVMLSYDNVEVVETIGFRSIYATHGAYIKHVLRTMAIMLAKKYFNIMKVTDDKKE